MTRGLLSFSQAIAPTNFPSISIRRPMIIHADCILAMSEMEPSSIDAIICDPPYAISFMQKSFDTFESPQAYLDFTIRWATEALRVLKPGGSLLSFGGTRTFHRLTCGLEDAGFTIKDCLMWLYGQGFPKAQDLGKMIDKRLGVEREVVGDVVYADGKTRTTGNEQPTYGQVKGGVSSLESLPATPLAREWDGYKIGGIKPAWEPIIWATKPPEGGRGRARAAGGAWIDNVLTYGVGAVNVDECRIKTALVDDYGRTPAKADGKRSIERSILHGVADEPPEPSTKGRFPANLLLSHTPDCREVGTKRVKSNSPSVPERSNLKMFVQDGMGRSGDYSEGYADPDGYETISAWECAEDCPVRLLDEQSGVLTSGARNGQSSCHSWGGTFQRGGPCDASTGGASRFFYTSKATNRDSYNDHPTLKPTDLIEWLVRLVTRPGQTVLDPFAGSGTTGVAAIQSGREFILIEQDSHYVDICKRRTTDGAQQGMF